MGKKRQLTQRIAGLYGQKDIVAQAHGGTNQSDKPGVISQDQIVTKDRIRKPQGLVPLTGNKVALADIDGVGDLLNVIALVGDTEVFTGSINEYFINNNDSGTTYDVGVDFGSAVLSAADKITYIAPAELGTANLTVNGNTFTITVSNNRPRKPTFISPAQNATNVGRVQLFTAVAMTISGPGVPNHDKSDWQIASDSGFTSIVSQTTDDATNKTSWAGTLTTPNMVYYARVRYHDAVLGWGGWSDTLVFTTKAHFALSSEVAKLMASDSATSDYFGNVDNDYMQRTTDLGSISMSRDGGLVAVSSKKQQNNGSMIGSVYLYRKANSVWSEVKKLFSATTAAPTSMTLTIPSGGSITVSIYGASPSTTTYTSSQTITIPTGTTSVGLSGKGQNGSTSSGGLSWVRSGDMHLFSTTTEPLFQTHGALPPSFPPTYSGQTTTTGGYSYYNGLGYENYDSVTWVASFFPGGSYTGSSATAVFAGQTYTFPGGNGVAATTTTFTITLSTYSTFGRNIAIGKTASGIERLAVLKENSADGVSYTYDLVFYQNTTGDVWGVETTLSGITLGRVGANSFVFSNDGNTLFISDYAASVIRTYTYNSGWVIGPVITLTGLGINIDPTNIVGRIAVNQDGTKVALAAAYSSHLIADPAYLIIFQKTAGVWSKIFHQQVANKLGTSDTTNQAVYANGDFSIIGLTNVHSVSNGGSDEGSVSLYSFNGSLTFLQTIVSPNIVTNGFFGYDVSISNTGDVITIAEGAGVTTPKVHVYEKTNSAWVHSNTLTPHDYVAGDKFAAEMSMAADASAIAIHGYGGSTAGYRGAVYIFE